MKAQTYVLISIPLLAVTLTARTTAGNEIELDEAECFIEWNSTDGDFGIQFFWDGDPWAEMSVLTRGEEVMRVVADGTNLQRQGLTEAFFESAEPSSDELSMAEFLRRFLEGEFEFEGRTLLGDDLVGEADFTHSIPVPPSGLFPAHGDAIDASQSVVFHFDAVTTDLQGNPIEPELYQVVVETEDADEFEREFSVILRGDTQQPSVTIPHEFLLPGGEYKFEVIVEEESGNRTITETEFTTL